MSGHDTQKRTASLQSAGEKSSSRYAALDGMRAIAALSVVIFHYTYNWADPVSGDPVYAFGDLFRPITMLNYWGYFGVNLFFMISGFVIVLTLERSSGLLDFAVRRFARLWPAMFICATVTTAVVALAPRLTPDVAWPEYWPVTRLEYFSSIAFVEPKHVGAVFSQPDARWADGVYWTLWVEVLFYALAGAAYLLSPRGRFLLVWACVQTASTLYKAVTVAAPEIEGAAPILDLLQPRHLPWFTLGICAFHWRAGDRSIAIRVCLAAAVAALVTREIFTFDPGSSGAFSPDAPAYMLLYVITVAPMVAFVANSRILDLFAWGPFVSIGLASYPIYLVHHRVGLILARALHGVGVPSVLAMTVVFFGVIGFSLAVYKLIETPWRKIILARMRPLIDVMQARAPLIRYR